jgi:chemotaxis signal transduction protein
LRLSPVLLVPGSEEYICGIIEWRGIILPIIDLTFCVEKKKSDIKSDGKILVVRLTSLPLYIGIIIQSQVIIQSIPIKRDLDRQDNLLSIESIHQQFKFKNKTLVIPNIDKMVIYNNKVSPNTVAKMGNEAERLNSL